MLLHKHSLGYKFFTPHLNNNQILEENYWLIIPQDLKQKKYTFSVGFINITNQKIAKITINKKYVELDKRNKLILGTLDNS